MRGLEYLIRVYSMKVGIGGGVKIENLGIRLLININK